MKLTREQNNEILKRKLLFSAAKLFVQNGYTATSLRKICDDAKVNIGSFVNLYGCKENLMSEIVKYVLQAQFEKTDMFLSGTNYDKIQMYAAETTLQLWMAEADENIRELYIVAYSLQNTSEIIQEMITEKLEDIFKEHLPNLERKDFYMLEIASGGIMRGFLTKASPHMAGIYALEGEYYSTNPYLDEYNSLTGEDKVNRLENLAMTSAKIIRSDDGVAYSPRVQGAGMVNIENLLKSKVLIKGDGEKAKVSLKEIGNEFSFNFDVTNITEEDVNFDKISIELLTDGYTNEADEYYVGDTIKLTENEIEEIIMPESFTVKSGETEKFTAKGKLKQEFLDENKKIFANGFFIDGFIGLDMTNDETYAAVPFTGIYGEWYNGNMKIFGKTTYDEGGSYL